MQVCSTAHLYGPVFVVQILYVRAFEAFERAAMCCGKGLPLLWLLILRYLFCCSRVCLEQGNSV